MSRADLFVEAIDTVIRLGWALAVWIVLCSLFASAAVYAVVVIVVGICRWAWQAARRSHSGPSWRYGRRHARHYARTRTRRPRGHTRPHWARTQPINDYEEAA